MLDTKFLKGLLNKKNDSFVANIIELLKVKNNSFVAWVILQIKMNVPFLNLSTKYCQQCRQHGVCVIECHCNDEEGCSY